MTKSIKIYTDGGSRGNPGPAAGGIVIFDNNDKLLKINAKYFGRITNNQAEYEALISALRTAQLMNVSKVKCYLDSELIVKQLNGVYKIKSDNIRGHKETVDKLSRNFDSIEYFHVTREKNTFADKLVNIVLDSKEV
ncbi:ribonuclease HI family protein [Patescibacteria group bacterium]